MSLKKTAFVFPGQGSQSLNMLSSFPDDCQTIKKTFESASESLGYDIWRLVKEGPIAKLNQTVYTQPILLTISVALWELWKSQHGTIPEFLAGHSLGEYTAYTCSGSLTLEEAVQLVSHRGAYMQEAVQEIKSAMAVVVGLSYETVSIICETVQEDQVVQISNYNTLDQIIISGHDSAVARAIQEAKEKGARLVKLLPISVPAHCDLMRPAVPRLVSALENTVFKSPNIPVISNELSMTLSDIKAIKVSLVSQLYQPVHWVSNIQFLVNQGVSSFIECGPGQVLTGLIRRIVPQAHVISIGDDAGFKKALLEG